MLDHQMYFVLDINAMARDIENRMFRDKNLSLGLKDKSEFMDMLTLDDSVVDRLLFKAPELSDCLFFFSRKAIFRQVLNGVEISVYKFQGENVLFYRKYSVTHKAAGFFFHFLMYTDSQDFEGYNRVKSFDILYDYVLPSPRFSTDDGQLKILTDVILAVDTLNSLRKLEENVEPVSVLVAGSAAPLDVSAGESYQIIPYMVPVSSMELYDPNEFCMDYAVEGLISSRVIHHSSFHEYKKQYYDLILDDVYSDVPSKNLHNVRDFFQIRKDFCKVFSAKMFPNRHGIEFGSTYYQVCRTSGNELRWVSHARQPRFFPNERLGTCYFCNELKFYLKNDYDDSVFDFFMRMHKKNCVTGEYRKLISVFKEINLEFDDVSSPTCTFLKDVYRFPWDRKLEALVDFISIRETSLNSNLLSKQVLVVSSLSVIPFNFYSVIRFLVVLDRVDGGFKLRFRGKCEEYYEFLSFKGLNYDVRTNLVKFSSRSKDGYSPLKERKAFIPGGKKKFIASSVKARPKKGH